MVDPRRTLAGAIVWRALKDLQSRDRDDVYWRRQAAAYVLGEDYALLMAFLSRAGFKHLDPRDLPAGVTWTDVRQWAGEFDEEE